MTSLFLSLCLALPMRDLPPAEPDVGLCDKGRVYIRGDTIRVVGGWWTGRGKIEGSSVYMLWTKHDGDLSTGVYWLDDDGMTGCYWSLNNPERDWNETLCWR